MATVGPPEIVLILSVILILVLGAFAVAWFLLQRMAERRIAQRQDPPGNRGGEDEALGRP